MSFRDFLSLQHDGLKASATSGVIGLHLVSGPLVGFAIGYGLDAWLGTSPWCKLIFLFVGIGAGFLNVYRDTRQLMRKMDAERRFAGAGGGAGAEAGGAGVDAGPGIGPAGGQARVTGKNEDE